VVVLVAHRLAGHLTWAGLGEFAVIFTLVWIAWANRSLHHELHGHDDARARMFVTGTAACAVLLAGTTMLPASARMPA
jgi:low temperature requirement protein LtrA